MTPTAREYWLRTCPSREEHSMISNLARGACLVGQERRCTPAYPGSTDEFLMTREWYLWAMLTEEQQLLLEIGLSGLLNGVKSDQ